jgi:energy-coupling factor transport system permease protein
MSRYSWMRGPLVPTYRRRPTVLHAARAGAGAAWCASLALVAGLYENPLVLAGALAAVVAAGALAGVGREVARSARLAVPLAVLIVAVNAFVSQEGTTILVRGGNILGRHVDVTLEAVVFGWAAALRLLVLILAFGVFSAVVDPDELLRLFRRFSYRSALTASLATRLVPVLARDATHMGEAARCRAHPPGRTAAARAALGRALERSVDVAAALETRGYASARRPRRVSRPWSRHDVAVAGTAALVAALAIAGKAAGLGAFAAYPTVWIGAGAADFALAIAIALAPLLPFAVPGARLGLRGRRVAPSPTSREAARA